MGKAIALATPFFFLLIAVEYTIARAKGLRAAYRVNDAVNSLSLGVISQVVNLFVRVLTIGIYIWIYERVALGAWPLDQWWAWVAAIVFYDFCYYWNHRLGHESAVFWASHVVHHQSQCYNLSTALRQTSSGALLGWIFYVPMAIAGVPPEMFAVAAVVDLLYQYWIHTELVGKLGWFDRWFASPSNHRVHHAVNDRYIDRNYGGIFMLWDRLFGTFVEESERCVYGTRAPLNSWDPLWANLAVYAELARKSWRCPRWRDKALTWVMPPGWDPGAAAVTARQVPTFDLAQVRTYDPPMSAGVRRFALLHLSAAILATMPLLWFAQELGGAALLAWAGAIVAVLWLTGAVMQARLRLRTALTFEAIVLGVVLAVTNAAATNVLPSIHDDAGVQSAVERARTEFLETQKFDRLQVSVLLQDASGRWLRGAIGGDELAYPASVVKLGFLVAAVHWCAEQGQPPACLDEFARPMIVDSDNVATGALVDIITGAPNAVAAADSDVDAWIERRRYAERLLDAAGLLGAQRLLTKTYPTNSGDTPAGLERIAWERVGRNAMTPNHAAALLLGIVSGSLEPQATSYMRTLLRRPTMSGQGSLGGGLPAGTLHENKVGTAFDTLQDIMYAELDGGHRLIIAAFSNAWEPAEPGPWDVAKLGGFTELLLRELGLARVDGSVQLLQPTVVTNDSVRWEWQTARAGRHEIAVWYTADRTNTTRAVARLPADATGAPAGNVTAVIDQTVWGERWIKLGDIDMAQGLSELVIERVAPGRLAPGKLRVARWPD
jgi:alkylglycerol monooxygenase